MTREVELPLRRNQQLTLDDIMDLPIQKILTVGKKTGVYAGSKGKRYLIAPSVMRKGYFSVWGKYTIDS